MGGDDLRKAHKVHPITAVQLEWSLWTRDAEVGHAAFTVSHWLAHATLFSSPKATASLLSLLFATSDPLLHLLFRYLIKAAALTLPLLPTVRAEKASIACQG